MTKSNKTTARAYNYIRYRKTITNPQLIRQIEEISRDKSATHMDTITRLIGEGAAKEIATKRKMSEL